jgi:hypothetical protein
MGSILLFYYKDCVLPELNPKSKIYNWGEKEILNAFILRSVCGTSFFIDAVQPSLVSDCV